MPHENPSEEALRQILTDSSTIAVVGASSNPERPSYGITKRLIDAGYRVFPVNPRESEILGQKAYARLADVPEALDIVDVFRRGEDTPPIADEAVLSGAKVLWLQEGVVSEEAAQRARDGGLTVVMDKCIGATHALLGIAKKR